MREKERERDGYSLGAGARLAWAICRSGSCNIYESALSEIFSLGEWQKSLQHIEAAMATRTHTQTQTHTDAGSQADDTEQGPA